MGNVWDANIAIDAAMAARLIEHQFPKVGLKRINLLSVSRDNAAFLVNEALVFRFPRRQIVVDLIERKVRLLPLIGQSVGDTALAGGGAYALQNAVLF